MAIVKSYAAILSYSTKRIPGIVYEDEKGNRIFFGDEDKETGKCHPDFLLDSNSPDFGEQSANEGRASLGTLKVMGKLVMVEYVGGVFDVTIEKVA
jgi:hypothetical protein